VTFEEWRKEHLSMDGYPQYTAEDAWQAGRLAALREAASQWDGCFYEDVGERIDIGAAIRALSQKESQ
jgi:hypothetical protein